MWTEAFEAGAKSAQKLTGTTTANIALQIQGLLAGQSAAWAAQIAATTVNRIAGILALAAGLALAELVARIEGVLADAQRAAQIAITEITRLMALAAQWIYQMAGITLVEWVTEHDSRVCPACEANQAQGPHPLGVPFSSGAPWPPGHPGCRCALVPVER